MNRTSLDHESLDHVSGISTTRNHNSYKFSHKFPFIPSLYFHRSQKQESNFQQFGDPVTRNVSVFLFLASRPLLQRYAEFSLTSI